MRQADILVGQPQRGVLVGEAPDVVGESNDFGGVGRRPNVIGFGHIRVGNYHFQRFTVAGGQKRCAQSPQMTGVNLLLEP